MYRKFDFEGAVHEALDCVPLTVRRKLDLAGLKISLEGWQRLPRAQRVALCHLPVDQPGDVEVYREVLRGFAETACVELKPLPAESMDASLWSERRVPEIVNESLAPLGLRVADEDWLGLDEECRYALVKLADPKRGPEKLLMLVRELKHGQAKI